MFFTSPRSHGDVVRYLRSAVIIVNAIPRLSFRSCNAFARSSALTRAYSSLSQLQLRRGSLHPAQVMSYESHSRNFNLIVPLSQLATATGPSFAINRLRVVGLSRRILNKNKLVYCTLFLSLPSLLCLFLSTIPYALFILLSRPFFSPCFFLSLCFLYCTRPF